MEDSLWKNDDSTNTDGFGISVNRGDNRWAQLMTVWGYTRTGWENVPTTATIEKIWSSLDNTEEAVKTLWGKTESIQAKAEAAWKSASQLNTSAELWNSIFPLPPSNNVTYGIKNGRWAKVEGGSGPGTEYAAGPNISIYEDEYGTPTISAKNTTELHFDTNGLLEFMNGVVI